MQMEMSDVTLPAAVKAREEATIWVSRLERGLRDTEGLRLREWLQESLNRESIMDAARLWHGPEILAALSELIPVTADRIDHKRRQRFLKVAVLTALATTVTALPIMMMRLSMSGASLETQQGPPIAITRVVYTTAVGERREVRLADTSTMLLNTRTHVIVDYSLHSRDVYLQYGEASFIVAQEAQRPFYLRAGKLHFEAAQTSFNVRVLSPEDVEVTVAGGNLKTLGSSPTTPETPDQARLRDNMISDVTMVSAGEMAQVEPGFQFSRKISATQAEALLAWQHGMIVFSGESLEEALAEEERYANVRFVLSDEKLRNIRITGQFRAGDIDGLLACLRQNLHIDARRDADQRIVLSPLSRL